MTGKVEVYGKAGDGPTEQAISLLEEQGAFVSFLDVGRIKGADQEVLDRGGRIVWPQVFLNNRAVGTWKDLEELHLKGDLGEWLVTRFQQA